jgi:hypothetical protein
MNGSLRFELQQDLWNELWDIMKTSVNNLKSIFKLGFIVGHSGLILELTDSFCWKSTMQIVKKICSAV